MSKPKSIKQIEDLSDFGFVIVTYKVKDCVNIFRSISYLLFEHLKELEITMNDIIIIRIEVEEYPF